MTHDPERQASDLLQCLREDKKPLGLLLGAGCPYSVKDESGQPLIPDISGLTELVKSKLQGECAQSWDSVCEQLTDECRRANIENVLSRVRGLLEYVGNGEMNGLNKKKLAELEKRICEEVTTCACKQLPDQSSAYHNLAVWIGATGRSEPVEIFTTNYDLLIEQALEDARIPFFDGFVGSRKPFFDLCAVESEKLPARWARLWKIHGSVNWRSEASTNGVRIWRSTESDPSGNVVIHPSHLKYDQSRKMPYLALTDRLRRFLISPSAALIVIGYSFQDQHLNDVMAQALQGSPTAVVFALMFGALGVYRQAADIARNRGNLILIADDGAVIGTKEASWVDVRERPDSNLPAGAVEWAPENGSFRPTFRLGDFQRFGSFLQDMSGMGGLG